MTADIVPLEDWQPTARQQRLIDTIAHPPFPSTAEACRQLRIPYDTARKWKRTPTFRRALDAAREEATREMRAQIREGVQDLVDLSLQTKRYILEHHADEPQAADRVATWILERVDGKTPEEVQLGGRIVFSIDAGNPHARVLPAPDDEPA